jgi:hypothetical protein
MTRDRASSITLSGRRFATIIAGDDKHWWELADPAEQPEFDRLWGEMARRVRGEELPTIESARTQ